MNSKKYWEDREKQKLKEQLKDVKKLESELKKVFTKASKDIEREIFSLFTKYAEDNNLNYAQASQLLTSKEFKQWKYDLKGYMKLIEQTGDEQLLLELNTLAMKSRISRLEEMLYQVNKYIDETFKTFEGGVYDLLEGSVSKSYYQTIYDTHKFIGVGASFSFVDKEMIEEILSYPWSGFDFKTRIKINRDEFKKIVKQEITQMIIQGNGSKEVAKSIAKKAGTSLSNAYRLVHTEHSWVMGEATAKAYKELDVEYYQYSSALDKRTCSDCGKWDGEIIKLSERVVGVNASPLHPMCRCTELPYIEDNYSTRFARDAEGKGIEVPSNMTYKQWKKEFGID